MKDDKRIEKAVSRRAPKEPRAASRPDARGTLDRLIAKIDARRPGTGFGAAFRAGGLVRHMRREAGLSQQQLAKAIGVSQARISEIEAGLGAQGPTWSLMERVAAACGRTIIVTPQASSIPLRDEFAGRLAMNVHESAARASSVDASGHAPPDVVHDMNLDLIEHPAGFGGMVLAGGVAKEASMSRLTALRVEHRDLVVAIDALRSKAAPDQLQLARLKKRRLRLKEEIRSETDRRNARVRTDNTSDA